MTARLNDLFDFFDILSRIDTPVPPVTRGTRDQPLTFPSEQGCARHIKEFTYLNGFKAFFRICLHHQSPVTLTNLD